MERSEEAIDRFLYRKKYLLQSFTPYQNHPSPNFYKYTRISTLHQPWNPPKHLQFNFSAISKNMIYIESCRHLVRPLSISRIVTQKTQVERERESENKRGFTSVLFVIRRSSIFSWSRVGRSIGVAKVDRNVMHRGARAGRGSIEIAGGKAKKRAKGGNDGGIEGFTCADSIIKISWRGHHCTRLVGPPVHFVSLGVPWLRTARVSRNLTRKLFKLHSRGSPHSHPRLPSFLSSSSSRHVVVALPSSFCISSRPLFRSFELQRDRDLSQREAATLMTSLVCFL